MNERFERVQEAATHQPHKPSVTRTLEHEMAKEQRPREKMLERGGAEMSDAELLAIILGSGFVNHNVMSVAQAVLKDYGNFAFLGKASIDELMKYDGIGRVKAIQLATVMEIAKRTLISQHDTSESSLLVKPELVVDHVLRYKVGEDSESFFVLPLNKKCRLCGPVTEVTRGTLDASLVHPREVFRVALRWSAASIIVAHNHPSGDPTPSAEDLGVTRRLIEAGRVIAVPLTDHVVVGDAELFPPGFHSIRRSGVIAFD